MTPASEIASILNNTVSYLITFTKFGFVITLLTNKVNKENVVSKKIDEFVKKALDYIQKEA